MASRNSGTSTTASGERSLDHETPTAIVATTRALIGGPPRGARGVRDRGATSCFLTGVGTVKAANLRRDPRGRGSDEHASPYRFIPIEGPPNLLDALADADEEHQWQTSSSSSGPP